MKVAISIGHHPEKPGITSGQYTEHSEMATIVGFMIQTLIYMGHKPYVVAAGPLSQKIKAVNALKPDCAIELHLNAVGGSGVETLFCPGSRSSEELASAIHRGVMRGFSEALNVDMPNRGTKEGWYRMVKGGDKDAFLSKTKCPACITEMYFLDNKDERKKFAGSPEFYMAMAFAVVSALNEWSEAK